MVVVAEVTDTKCNVYFQAEEHIKHIVVGCTTLPPSEYTNRQNKVVGYIHWMVCKHMGLQVTDKYYEHIPERVTNVNGTTIMWDIPVITVQTMLANQPDTVLHDRKGKSCLLINMAIPDDSNINTKETEKESMYKY